LAEAVYEIRIDVGKNQSKAQVVAHLKSIFLENFYSSSHIELRESGIKNREYFSHQTRMFVLLRKGRILNIMKDMKQQNTVNLGNICLSNQFNLCNLWLEVDQSK